MTTAIELITGAYYAAGVVGREFETVSGSQLADGLVWLNDVLGQKRVDMGMIAYETTYKFTAREGVERYFIPGLIKIDTIVFYLNTVRYAMQFQQRNSYFGSSRVENITSLPNSWYFEKQTGGGNLYIYFKPNQNYPIEIHGSFEIPEVKSLTQDLSSNITVKDLGVPKIYSDGELLPGQLVINNFDLYGINTQVSTLIKNINKNVVGVRASLNVNNLVLTSTTQPPQPIYVQTNGYESGTNHTNFIGNVKACNADNTIFIGSTYFNGVDDNGVGATLTSNVPSTLVIDGYTVSLGDRVLLKSDVYYASVYAGCYEVTTVGTGLIPWVLTRTTNYDQAIDINEGDIFTVTNGVVNKGKSFIQTAEVEIIGLSQIDFSVFSAITFSNFSTIETPFYDVSNAIGFDKFYITYLRYALTERICAENNLDTPPNVTKQLIAYQDMIDKKSKVLDLTVEKVSTLQRGGTYNYAYINLGRGWTPS